MKFEKQTIDILPTKISVTELIACIMDNICIILFYLSFKHKFPANQRKNGKIMLILLLNNQYHIL